MNIGDVLDVAALLALRIDPEGIRHGHRLRDDVRHSRDVLQKLIEHWRWSLAVERPRDMRRASRRESESQGRRSAWNAPAIEREGVRDRAGAVTEILATELLMRVYNVMLIASGSTARDAELKELLDEINSSMSDVGHFARQQFILLHPDLSWSIKLYRLQKRLDRWSDLLLAPTLESAHLDRFWINRKHLDDWIDHPWRQMDDRDVAGRLFRRAIQSAVSTEAVVAIERVRMVEELIGILLMLIPDDDFTADGVLMSQAQSRAARFSLDSQFRPRRLNN
jgi:hypothetical protein